jgi:hypothetical protein
MIGGTIAHYRVTAKLGECGMGEVELPPRSSDFTHAAVLRDAP